MVIGNEYIFEDILQASAYILEHEEEVLANDKTRQKAPICCPFSDFTKLFEEQSIRIIPPDSLEYPCAAYFNDADDSKFIMNKLMSGRYALKPNLRNHKFLFRGETEFHSPCKPSLFRDPKKKYFLDYMIHGDEMFYLILSHPLVQLLDLGVVLNGELVRFEMNLYGLIQHYYNKSALLDLTSDMNVALFFATQKYDWKTDSYSPLTDESHEPGVLYFYDIDPFRDFQMQPNEELLSTIGLQVFPRSGRQRGFIYQCPMDINFNDLSQVKAFRFKHNAKIAQSIYESMNGGEKLFPHDVLQAHWKDVTRDENKVSLKAIHFNLTRNEEENLDSIRTKLEKDCHISVEDYEPVLTKDELHEYYKAVKDENLWEDFCNQIYIPGDIDGKMMADLLDVPNKPEYEWAFKEGIEHEVDYDKGFLLKEYKHILQ